MFQVVSAPDGLALHFYGPMEERRHDVHMLAVSGLESQLQSKLHVNGMQFCLYADSAYTLREYLLVGTRGSSMSGEETVMNRDLSRASVVVEWFFRDVKKYFAHVKTVHKMAASRFPVSLWYECSAVLWNFRCCLYRSPTAQFFDCPPPSLEDYVAMCF